MLSSSILMIAFSALCILLITSQVEGRNTYVARRRGTSTEGMGARKSNRNLKSPKSEPPEEEEEEGVPSPKSPKSGETAPKSAPKAPKSAPKSPTSMPKQPKSPKSQKVTPAPVVPVPPPVTPPVAPPVDQPTTDDKEKIVTPSPTSITSAPSKFSSSTKAPSYVMNCTVDSDCGDGWFCMENFTTCCAYNTTCRVGRGPPMSSSAVSLVQGVATTLFSGFVIAIALW